MREPAAARLREEVERLQVPHGEVDNVDVVAHARSILRVILVAEHGEAFPLADSHLRSSMTRRHQDDVGEGKEEA